MATIKSYTDLEQSKKLAEILPIESADMIYQSVEDEYGDGTWEALPKEHPLNIGYNNDISCWSLTALLEILPNPQLSKDNIGNDKVGWMVTVYPNSCRFDSNWNSNAIDACYEMILKLHELKML